MWTTGSPYVSNTRRQNASVPESRPATTSSRPSAAAADRRVDQGDPAQPGPVGQPAAGVGVDGAVHGDHPALPESGQYALVAD